MENLVNLAWVNRKSFISPIRKLSKYELKHGTSSGTRVPNLEKYVPNEASFIFTAKSWDGRVFVIIENVNPDRSTLLFKIERDMYMTALHTIFDYIQSDVINKRSAIRDRDINFYNVGW